MSSLGLDTTAKMLSDLLWSRFVGDIGKTDRYLCDSTPTPVWSSAPLTEQVVADHVLGRKRIGVGQVGSTLFGVLDFDGKVKDADGKSVLDPVRVEEAWANTRRVVDLFNRHGFKVLVEVSRSGGGWHVWVLCDPVDPPTVEEMRHNLWVKLGIPYDKTKALTKYASSHGLGAPVTDEVYQDKRVYQGFVNGWLWCVEGDWAIVHQESW